MRATDRYSPGRQLFLGCSPEPPLLDPRVPCRLRSRNNALLDLALRDFAPTLGEQLAGIDPARVAIVLGTSTSGMEEAESALRALHAQGSLPPEFHYGQQELASPAEYLAWRLGTTGPAYVIATACASGAKAFASGARLLAAGMADVVLVGGVDTLCRFTVAGFSALGAVSAARTNPFSRNRCGVNIGEGAALFLLSRHAGPVRLAGWGETSDGHHVSAPDPQGGGARDAIAAALRRAGLPASAIDYVNLHGTGTQQNDAMESRVIDALLPGVPASSTKPLTGHALGAAGAVEAALCWLALTADVPFLPAHLWDGESDPELPALNLVAPGAAAARAPRAALSLSFAFGGSNAALLLASA
jgi:3-oxoacyl-[acyl-carrier-protein] synthase-1